MGKRWSLPLKVEDGVSNKSFLSPGSNPQEAGKAVTLSALSDGKKRNSLKRANLEKRGGRKAVVVCMSVCVCVEGREGGQTQL